MALHDSPWSIVAGTETLPVKGSDHRSKFIARWDHALPTTVLAFNRLVTALEANELTRKFRKWRSSWRDCFMLRESRKKRHLPTKWQLQQGGSSKAEDCGATTAESFQKNCIEHIKNEDKLKQLRLQKGRKRTTHTPRPKSKNLHRTGFSTQGLPAISAIPRSSSKIFTTSPNHKKITRGYKYALEAVRIGYVEVNLKVLDRESQIGQLSDVLC